MFLHLLYVFIYNFTSFNGEHVGGAPHAVIPEVEFPDQFFTVLTMDHVSCYFSLLCEHFICLNLPRKQT